MFDELFDLTIEGAFSSQEEFNEFAQGASKEEIYQVLQEGAFADFNEFSTVYDGEPSPVKKKDVSDSNLETEVTESTTTVETTPGSSDGLEESEVSDTFLEEDFENLSNIDTATISGITPGASARAQAMRQLNRQIDPKLQEKILSDYNISRALEMGIIDDRTIESALKGNKNAIKKLSQLSRKSSEYYQKEIDDKKLNNPYAYESSSELTEFVSPEGEAETKKSIRDKIKAYDAESARLQAENPNATADELNALINRPDDPNFVTEEEYELVEDDYTPTGFEDSDVHMMYDSQGLKNVKGFNVKDFDGYLKEQGYMEKYKQMLEDDTISEDGRYYDYSGNYNPTLAAERLKAQYLTNYINNQVERNVDSQVLKYQLENDGRHPSFDGVQLNFSTGVDDIALSSYIEKQFPSLTAQLKEQDVANQENYQKYLDGENPWFTQSVKQGWRSVEDRIHSFSKGAYGYIGMNSVADEIRMRDAQDDLERDDFMRYSYSSGKKAFVNGREYGIDERGQIYDLEIKKNVTNVLTGPMADSIRKGVSKSNETFKSFSAAGTAIATAGIASDMMLQIALTRGVGNVGRGGAAFLGSFDKGTKAVNILKSIPMKGTTASAMIAQGTLFSTNLASSTYDQAIASGLDEGTALELRQLAGKQGFALGALTAPISTQAVAMNKFFGSKGTEKVTKQLVAAYQKGGEKGVKSYFQRIQQKIIQNYPVYARESGKEMFQENVQQAGQAFVIADNVNELASREIMNNTITGAEYTNTTILSGLAGLLMPFGGDLSSATTSSVKANFMPGAAAIDRLEALHGLSKDVDKTTKFLNSMVNQGVYTEKQVSQLLGDIDVYVNTINNIPPNLSPETSLVVMNSVNKIQKLEQLKKDRDKSFHPEIDRKLQELRNEITSRTQFDYVNAKGRLKLKDEAARELTQEAEAEGKKDFTIDDGAITQRAIDNFNKMDVDQKLEYTDLTKQDLKTDKTKEDAVQKPETGDVSNDQQSETIQEVEEEVRESSKETQEEVVPVKEEVYEEGVSTIEKGKTITTYTTFSDGSVKQTRKDIDANGNVESETEKDITSEFRDKVLNEDGKSVDLTVDRFAKQVKSTKKVSEKVFENEQQQPVDTSTDEEVEERIKDSQIPVSVQDLNFKTDEGEVQSARIITRMDGSRNVQLKLEDGTIYNRTNIKKDNTLSNEEYVGVLVATDQNGFTATDVDIKTVRNPKMEAKMSNRQRKAAGMTVDTDTETDTEADTTQEVMSVNKKSTPGIQTELDFDNPIEQEIKTEISKAKTRKDYRKQQTVVLDKVSALVKSGKISSSQGRAVINKIKRTSFDNNNQVQNLLDYSKKVFANADFAKDLETANKLSTRTTKKVNSGKLGDNGNLNAAISQLVTTPLADLDPATLKSYNEFLAKIAKRSKTTKLDNELVKEANDLLKSITPKAETEQEIAKAEKESESTRKVVDKILNPEIDGETILKENSDFIEKKLDALDSATLEILVDKINSAENENNSEIIEGVNDYAKNRQSLININAKKSKEVKLNNLSKISLDQSIGPRTLKNLNKGQLAMLTGTELAELDIHLENISEGFYTYYANKIAQKVEANQRATNISPILNKMFTAKGKFSTMRQYATASVKNGLGKVGFGSSRAARDVGIRGQMIRSNPLSVMDQMFGNYKNNAIYENSIRPTAEAHARFKNWINEQTDIIDTVESLIAPTRKESINDAVQRRFELTTYLLQQEFESNSNKKGTAPAIKFIEGTIARYNSDKRASKYNKNSIAILENIISQYSEGGQISIKKMDEAMSPKTKKALKLLQGVYSGLGDLQAYATRIVRGNELDLVNNYVHHKADFKGQERDDANFKDAISYLSLKPGTKSSTSFERSGQTAIDFDPITTALRATRNTGMDYFMSNEISTTRQSMSALKKMTENDDSKTEEQQDQLNQAVLDLNKIYSEALNNVVTNNMSTTVLGGRILNKMRTLGYYSTLASVPRAGAELASNLAFAALSAPSEMALGSTKYVDLSMTNKGRIIVENVSSTLQTKLYSDEQLGGSKTESQGVTKKKTSPKARGKTGETVEYVTRVTGVKFIPKAVEKIGETLVTKPDQMISRPLWFGTFAKTFKAETGTEIDFDKIADNDSDYMNEYKEAIQNATRKADNNVTMAATSNDPFSSVLKNQAQDGEGAMNFYRMINGYMSRFSLNEYATSRQAVASMMGQGQMGVVRGAGTMAGVGIRMTMYVMLLRYLNGAMFGMLGIGDEDDTDYEELGIRQAVGAATSLISRGVSGNVPMIPVNFTIESLNKEYGYDLGLRSKEEYDGLQDALVYATINPSNASKNLEEATLLQLTGPFNPYAKAAFRIGKLGLRASTNKTEESRQENLDKLFSSRTAIEMANLFGGVPFYRDIRRGFLQDEFKTEEESNIKPFSLEYLKENDPKRYKEIQREKKKFKNTPEYKRQQREAEKIKKQNEKALENMR